LHGAAFREGLKIDCHEIADAVNGVVGRGNLLSVFSSSA
jgi:hypothetical protein